MYLKVFIEIVVWKEKRNKPKYWNVKMITNSVFICISRVWNQKNICNKCLKKINKEQIKLRVEKFRNKCNGK